MNPEHTTAEERKRRGKICAEALAQLEAGGVDLWECGLIVRLITHLEATLVALVANLSRCGSSGGRHGACDAVGVWEWYDHDGEEWKCDVHKEDHFYINGPCLDAARVAARSVLDE